MIKSIKLKLWLTLFVTLAISLGVLLLITFFSVKKHFLDYATTQILERLAPLERAVAEEFEHTGSLQVFTKIPQRWNQLRDTTYREYLRYQNQSLAVSGANPRDWSNRESIEAQLQPKQRAFFQNLILLDEQKQLVTGRLKEGAHYVHRPIYLEQNIIAHIGYVKPSVFLSSVDELFVEQQINAFVALTLLMILVAIGVTAIVSRWLVSPLSSLAHSTNQVASGDFSVRLNHHSKDELGTLFENFNHMTRSLEKNEVMRKQWVADISHEMRTPLSVLKAQVEAMEDGIRPANKENLQLLQKNIDSLSRTINDLYELSLTDIGALSLNKERVEINDIALSTWNAFNNKFALKHFAAEAPDIPTIPTWISADKNRIQQLFTNLLENSYRYTNEHGTIKLSIKEENNTVTLILEDSAPGVPEENLDRIYDRLFRVEDSRSRETGGAGLGLSICQAIVTMHEGTIHASPSELGGLKQIITFKKHDHD